MFSVDHLLLLKIDQVTDFNALYKSTQANCILFSQMLEC